MRWNIFKNLKEIKLKKTAVSKNHIKQYIFLKSNLSLAFVNTHIWVSELLSTRKLIFLDEVHFQVILKQSLTQKE